MRRHEVRGGDAKSFGQFAHGIQANFLPGFGSYQYRMRKPGTLGKLALAEGGTDT